MRAGTPHLLQETARAEGAASRMRRDARRGAAPSSLGRRELELTLSRAFQTPEARAFLEARAEDPLPETHTHTLSASHRPPPPAWEWAPPPWSVRPGSPPTPGGTVPEAPRDGARG